MGPCTNATERRGRFHRRQRPSRRWNNQGAGGKSRSPDPDCEPGGFLASRCAVGITRAGRRLRPDIRPSGCCRKKYVMRASISGKTSRLDFRNWGLPWRVQWPDGRDFQVAFSKLALLHFRSPKTAGPSSGSVLFVADLFHPVDRAAVQRLLNSDMHHRRGARRAVPVLLTGCKPHDIAGPDFLDGPAPALHPSGTERDNQRLAERMRMPGRARARLESDARRAVVRPTIALS